MKYLHIGLIVALAINLMPVFEEENAPILGSYNGGDAHQFRVEKDGERITDEVEVWISHRIGSERRANDRTVTWIVVFYVFYGACTLINKIGANQSR